MTGTSDNTFSPGDTLTRAMAVTILHRCAGKANSSGLENPFIDLVEGAWYADAIKWAVANGIVTGYGNGRFGPNDPVNNEQLALMIYRFAQSCNKIPPDAQMTHEWSDQNTISNWAVTAVTMLTAQGVYRDQPRENFNPKAPATRAEIASMLYCCMSAEIT